MLARPPRGQEIARSCQEIPSWQMLRPKWIVLVSPPCQHEFASLLCWSAQPGAMVKGVAACVLLALQELVQNSRGHAIRNKVLWRTQSWAAHLWQLFVQVCSYRHAISSKKFQEESYGGMSFCSRTSIFNIGWHRTFVRPVRDRCEWNWLPCFSAHTWEGIDLKITPWNLQYS